MAKKNSWQVATNTIEEGGSGINRVHDRISAYMTTHIWRMLDPQYHSEWKDRIKEHLMKTRSFCKLRQYPLAPGHTKNCLAVATKIGLFSKLRMACQPGSSLRIGLPKGLSSPLSMKKIIGHSSLGIRAKVSSIMKERQWPWPHPNTLELRMVKA